MTNAREIGVVFGQRSQLWWDLPVIDSFLLNQRIYAILESRFRDNLNHFAKLLDLDSLLDRAVRQLSLGQRMRCELVMALLHDPKVLILDDTTSALDVATEGRVQDAIREMMGDSTVFLVAQRISAVLTADVIVVLEDGRIVAKGSHNELLASSEHYRSIYESQLGPVTTDV